MKLGFTGPFADANFGDYGMLVNNIYSISNIERVALYSYDTNTVNEIWSEYLPDTPSENYSVVFNAQKLSALSADGRNPTPLEILAAVTNIDALTSSVKSIDRLVVNGGGYWNELWCQPHRLPKLLSILVPVLIAQELGKPIIFTANGFGPFGPRSAFLADILPALDTTFHVRDTISSAAALRRIGVAESNITYAPDDLFFFASPLIDRPSDVPERTRPYLVLETYMSIEKLEKIRPLLERFDFAMRNRGVDVVVVPFYSGRGGAEQAAWLGREFAWDVFDLGVRGFLRLEDARKLILDADMVLCERYHAAIVALANRVPVLHSLRDVAGDKRYYFSKSWGASYTAWGNQSTGSLHTIMTLDFEDALHRAINQYEGTRTKQFVMHKSVPVATQRSFEKLRQDVISKIEGA